MLARIDENRRSDMGTDYAAFNRDPLQNLEFPGRIETLIEIFVNDKKLFREKLLYKYPVHCACALGTLTYENKKVSEEVTEFMKTIPSHKKLKKKIELCQLTDKYGMKIGALGTVFSLLLNDMKYRTLLGVISIGCIIASIELDSIDRIDKYRKEQIFLEIYNHY